MPAGSLPAVGSVSPKQPISSPAAMPGSHCCFCSSEPCLWIALIASEPCTETKVRRPESPASSSSAARPYSTAAAAGAAVALQVHAEQAEIAESRVAISRGKCASSYHVAMFGRIRCVDEGADLVPLRQFLGAEQGVQVQVVAGPVADRGGRGGDGPGVDADWPVARR